MQSVKKKLGFGFMRLPLIGERIDIDQTCKMVDEFMAKGFNYFDTAHGYMNEKSESALKTCLVDRYPRESFVIADKLTNNYFEKQEDIRPFFEKQLQLCGVTYFDFYLMHAQGAGNYDKYKACNAYQTAFELKAEGKIRHVGISFHGTAQMLRKILTENPNLEFVQIQFNYLDYDDASVQSKAVYEVCREFNKPVIVMEPVKGGNLVNLPQSAQAVFDELKGGSNASYAIRFAAGFEGVFMVLSGMSNMAQLSDNVSYMQDFLPLNQKEQDAVNNVRKEFLKLKLIACTSCRYCVDGCPKKISIPDLFAALNSKQLYNGWNPNFYYEIHTQNKGKASDCVQCGLCEKSCPQNLPIRQLLKQVASCFEKND